MAFGYRFPLTFSVPDSLVLKYAATNNTPNVKSVAANTRSLWFVLPCITSTTTAVQYVNFSTIDGIIIGRNRTGSRAINKNAICHANAHPTNP
jgi:hypothetical protein